MSTPLRMLAALCCAALVSACAQPARVTQMTVANVAGTSVAADPALLGILAIDQVSGGQATDPMWQSEVGNAEFRAALENSLQANALLDATPADAAYKVSASLTKLDQPLFGADSTVTSAVAYRVVAADGTLFFEQSVTRSYTAKFGDALYGPDRLRLANEGSIENNIRAFIEAFVAHWRANKPTT